MRDADRGSIFIETLVAAAIVAMAMAVMLQSVVQGAASERRIETRRLALLVANSRLAAVGDLIALQRGEAAGSDGPFLWRVDIEPYQSDLSDHAGRLYLVSVRVGTDTNPSLVSLRSLRAAGGAVTP
jgi:hypothetical protein